MSKEEEHQAKIKEQVDKERANAGKASSPNKDFFKPTN